MSQGKWHSKRAVLKDLTRATGINSFHENAFVIGERPPPSRIVEDDVPEMYDYGGVTLNTPNEFEKPDLDGITQMIRMVDKYEERPEVIVETVVEKKNDVESIITISKLNPDVDEFLPSNNLIAKAELKNKFAKESSLQDKVQCNAKFKTQSDSMCVKNGKTLPTEVVHVNNDVDLEQMKEKLKTKISSTSNTTCFKAKRERNLAIATLLKLYSQAPSSVSTTNNVKTETIQSSTGDAPLKLMPPNYFDKSPSLEKNTEVNDRTENNKIILTKNVNEKPIERNTNNDFNINNSSDIVSISNIATAINKNKGDTKDDDVDNSTESSESIYEDSVAKVTKWFESNSNKASTLSTAKNKDYETDHQLSSASVPVQPSSSIKSTQKKSIQTSQEGLSQPFIGPVTFRKREGPKSNSPSLSASDKTPRQTPSNAYVPSDYANELSKMYMERANARKDLTDAIWANLEKKLKAKDEIIRQQMEERKKKQESSSNSD